MSIKAGKDIKHEFCHRTTIKSFKLKKEALMAYQNLDNRFTPRKPKPQKTEDKPSK